MITTYKRSQQVVALVAGGGIIIMTFFTLYAYNFIFPSIIVPNDAVTTASNIVSSEFQFRVGIASYAIVVILDIIVAWAFYLLFLPVNKGLSLLAAWLRLIYATIFGVALFNFYSVLRLVDNAIYLSSFGSVEVHAQIMLFLHAFDDGWAIGFIFFGLHVILIGFLILKSDLVPKLLGVLMVLAGTGYVADKFVQLLFPDFDTSLFTLAGWSELLLALWLLWKGLKRKTFIVNT